MANSSTASPTAPGDTDPGAFIEGHYPPEVSSQEAVEEWGNPTSFSAPEPPRADVNLNVPFIHQLWDTPDDFNGHWACGAASTTMVLAFYGALEPKPITISVPTPHQNPYGWYLSNTFTQNGYTFDATAGTPHDGIGRGIYGTALDYFPEPAGWCAAWDTGRKGIQKVTRALLTPKGIKARFEGAPTPQKVKASLDAGHPVISGGMVFGYGHLIVIKGYYCDPDGACHFIVNDPYSYQTRGRTYDGANVVYEWNEFNPGWMVMFSDADKPR